jgi:peroxygenase
MAWKWYSNRCKFGWVAAVFEWGTTYIMLWPVDGKVKKEEVKAVYDVRSFG